MSTRGSKTDLQAARESREYQPNKANAKPKLRTSTQLELLCDLQIHWWWWRALHPRETALQM
jgi:hypothetical protein